MKERKEVRGTKWQWYHVIPEEEGSERNYIRLNGFPDALKEPGMEMKSKWSDASGWRRDARPRSSDLKNTCYMCYATAADGLSMWLSPNQSNFDVQEAEEGGCGVQETGTSMTVQLCVSGLRENRWAWELSWFIQKYAWRDWSVSLDKGLWIHCRSTENQFTRWYHKEVTYHIMYHFTQSLCTGDLQM